jgi:hypothetical protein
MDCQVIHVQNDIPWNLLYADDIVLIQQTQTKSMEQHAENWWTKDQRQDNRVHVRETFRTHKKLAPEKG